MVPQTKVSRPASARQLATEASQVSDRWKQELTSEERARLAGVAALDLARRDAIASQSLALQLLDESPARLAMRARSREIAKLEESVAERRNLITTWDESERAASTPAEDRDLLDELNAAIPLPSDEVRRQVVALIQRDEACLEKLRKALPWPSVDELANAADWQRLAVSELAAGCAERTDGGLPSSWTRVATLVCGIAELRALDRRGELTLSAFERTLTCVGTALRGVECTLDSSKAARALANWTFNATGDDPDRYETLLRKGLLACGFSESDARRLFSCFAKRGKREAHNQ